MIYRTLRDPDADEMGMMLDLLADPGPGALPFLVDVEPDAIEIAARLTVENWPNLAAPLILDIVKDTLAALGIGGDCPNGCDRGCECHD